MRAIKRTIQKATKLKNSIVSLNKTGLPVHVAEDPLFSVVKGTGMVLEDINKYKEVLIDP